MAGLAELKEKTKNLTILYVEDSPILQKKMSIFLGKLFKTVYQANNGLEGLQSFNNDNPDIVLSDIDMPEMNGHEMIKEIKKLDPESNVIIYSAYADSENLLESIHNGVVDFIPKPVDINLFEKVLTKVVSKQTAKKATQSSTSTKQVQTNPKMEESNTQEIFKQLELIKRSHKSIEFVNHYKGVPIYEKGTIHTIEFEKIVVQVPYLQAQIIKYENNTVLISELFSHTIEATLEKFNSYNNTLVLKDLRYLQDKSKRRKEVSIQPNKNFSCKVSFKKTPLKSKVYRVSDEYIILELDLELEEEDKKVELIEGDELDLELLIKKQIDKTHIATKTLNLKGELYFIQEANEKYLKGMLLLEIDHQQKEILDEYVTLRRQELIVEFKHLKDKEN